ncbi:MAG: hypothetical protein M3459_03445 [Actinomycetota bacterium]|nr:hypothetical protein [Actinomycetota bacterium]
MARVAITVLVVVAAALVASQLALPPLAEDRTADDLEVLGSRPAVEVDALPAVRLLWGRADRVELRFPRASILPLGLGDQLARTEATDELDARIDELAIGPVALRDATLRKDGEALRAGAVAQEGDLVSALPGFLELRPVPGAGGDGLVFEGAASAFGRRVALRARLRGVDGRLVLSPDGLFGGFAAVTVFDDPRVRVEDLTAMPVQGGIEIAVEGRLIEAAGSG